MGHRAVSARPRRGETRVRLSRERWPGGDHGNHPDEMTLLGLIQGRSWRSPERDDGAGPHPGAIMEIARTERLHSLH